VARAQIEEKYGCWRITLLWVVSALGGARLPHARSHAELATCTYSMQCCTLIARHGIASFKGAARSLGCRVAVPVITRARRPR